MTDLRDICRGTSLVGHDRWFLSASEPRVYRTLTWCSLVDHRDRPARTTSRCRPPRVVDFNDGFYCGLVNVAASNPNTTIGPGRVLRHRDFRLFWIGALISNTGTWLQGAAVPYVLFKLTHSSTWVGMSVFASLAPGVIFGPLTGGIADRLDRRWMLFWIQTGSAVAALVMAALWIGHVRNPGTLLAVTAASGVFMGMGMPVWQGFVADLVPRSDLPAAVTLNSVQFHGSRAIGPALAGLILATVGPTWAFVGNGVSYVAVLVALWLVHARSTPKPPSGQSLVAEIRAGVTYTRNHTPIATAMLLVVAAGFLGNPIVQLAPEFSERVYKVGAGKYGLLSAAFGLGAGIGVYAVGQLTHLAGSSGLIITVR